MQVRTFERTKIHFKFCDIFNLKQEPIFNCYNNVYTSYGFFYQFLLEYGCFTMQCQPPLHSKMNQPYTYRYPSLLDFPPIQVTTVHQVEFRVLYGMFPSVVYFMHSISNVYVSIPVSQFLPPHSFPPWYPYICSLCLCLYALQIRSSIPFYIPHICVIIQYLLFSF